jgi:putative transposase
MVTRKRAARKPLGTIWLIPDELWKIIEPILHEFWPRKKEGRPPADWRRVLEGIIFRMRSGCQWDQLPKEFGSKSTVHDWFQRWNKGGVMEKIWATLVENCEELGGVQWEWQSADGAMAKARFGGIASAPTRRTEPRMAPSEA